MTWAEELHSHRQGIERHVMHRFRFTKEEAEDVASMTVLKMLRLGRPSVADPKNYLLHVSGHRAIEVLKKETTKGGSRRSVSFDNSVEPGDERAFSEVLASPDKYDIDEYVISKSILDTIEGLDLEMVVRWCEGWEEEENAAHYGMNVPGYKSRLYRVLEHVRKCADPEYVRPPKTREPGVSGLKGVYPHKGKWRAVAYYKGVRKGLGLYKTAKEASLVYQEYMSARTA